MPWEILAPVAGGVANSLFGGQGSPQAQLPADMQGTRANQIGLLNYLTGFGPDPRMNAAPTTHWKGFQQVPNQTQAPRDNWKGFQPPTPAQPSAQPSGGPNFGMGQGTGGATPSIAGSAAPQGGMPGMPQNDALTRLESYFGQLGIPTTALQRQSTGGMQQFLASNPYDQARTALNQILGSPGDAFRPDFDRALASANQSGGRFGSANALLRSNAVNDYNSQALKHALGAAQGIQGLGAQQSADLTSGYNMGTAEANQAASGQQQAIQLLLSQLQTAQGASFGAPVQQQPSGFGQFLQGAGGIAQLLPFLQGGGGGGGQPSPQNYNPSYQYPGFGGYG